ncbi:MAG: type II toxin-antitoxin system ParD family antitoxin [Elainellaceae cyanobacterium]
MTTITISLPEPLTDYLQEQVIAGGYNTPSDYIQDLILQDQQRKAKLEALVLEGLHSGPATPMTATDWDVIRASVQQNLADRPTDG